MLLCGLGSTSRHSGLRTGEAERLRTGLKGGQQAAAHVNRHIIRQPGEYRYHIWVTMAYASSSS